MNHKTLTVYEMWEVTVPSLPPRSELYRLTPLGLETALSESLTSYIARLAEAHSVPTGTFVVGELLPHYARSYLPKNRTVLWFAHARAFNGLNAWAKDMVTVVERLTLAQDLKFLTMLPWAEAISTLRLLRQHRAWCPTCFEVRRQAGQVIYEPLLWAFALATVCPVHGQPLQTCCPHCQQTLPWLEAYMRPGYCSRCKCWLGTSSTTTAPVQFSDAEFAWQLWMAKALGDLVAAAPGLPDLPQKAQLGQGLTQALNLTSSGNPLKFYQLLRNHNCHVSRSREWHWRTRQVLPDLYWLLRLCYCLRIPLVDLLIGQVQAVGPARTFTAKERPSIRSKVPKRDLKQIRQTLEGILADSETLPLSLNQTAKQLGYSGHASLMHTFPELSRAIVERYQQHQINTLAAHKQETATRIRQATEEIFQQGEIPTRKRVAAVLGKVGLNSQEATLMQQTLQELGH